MSGTSDTVKCPRCGRPNLQIYYDWKPIDSFSGICLDCGFHIYTTFTVNSEYQAEMCEEYEYEHRKLDKKELKAIKAFDACWGVEHE